MASQTRSFLAFCFILIAAFFGANSAYGAYSDFNYYKAFRSDHSTGSRVGGEYVDLQMSGHNLTVNFKSPIKAKEYRISVTNADTAKYAGALAYVTPKSDGSFSQTVDVSGLATGNYYFTITRARTTDQMDKYDYGDGGNCYRNALIRVTSNGVSAIRYGQVEQNNTAVSSQAAYNAPEAFLDTSLSDAPFLLINPTTDAVEPLTASQQKYIKDTTEQIVSGANGDYEKAKAVYSYIANNFYYDKYANDKGGKSYRYLNPYKNLYNQRNNLASKNSTSKGQVATICTGYASLSSTMLRSIGIPTRMVYGYHLYLPLETWKSIPDADIRNNDVHYWNEAYVNGRWITFDTLMGSSNKWTRSTGTSAGTWEHTGIKGDDKTGLNNFTYFDSSPEQLATTHFIQGIYSRTLITEPADVNRLTEFLNATDRENVPNFNKFGLKASDVATDRINLITWDSDRLYTAGKSGEVEKINFADVGLAGNADFSSMKKLKYFNISRNPEVETLNLSTNSNLVSAYASSCNLTKVEAANANKLKTLSVNYNPLTYAKYSFDGSKTATLRADEGGTFRLSKGTSYVVTARPAAGKRFAGWSTSAGTPIARTATLTVTSSTSIATRVAKFTTLPAPTGVKVATGTTPTSQKITWNKVTGASGYLVYRSTYATKNFIRTKTITSGSTTSFTKTALTPGKTYYYYVIAYSGSSDFSSPTHNRSAKSATVSRKMRPPTPKPTLTSGSRYITVKWPKITNVSGYQVSFATSSKGTYKTVKTITKNSSFSFKHTKRTKGKRYYYKVRAYKIVSGAKVYGYWSTPKSAVAK